MRLFGIVDGTVDRFDRAGWLTMPFDIAFAPLVTGPFTVVASQVANAGACAEQFGMANVSKSQIGMSRTAKEQFAHGGAAETQINLPGIAVNQ